MEAHNQERIFGVYPCGWRAKELGLDEASKTSIEFCNAVATDKIALDLYKEGYARGAGKPLADPALSDNRLAQAYDISRPKIRRCLNITWLPGRDGIGNA